MKFDKIVDSIVYNVIVFIIVASFIIGVGVEFVIMLVKAEQHLHTTAPTIETPLRGYETNEKER